MVHPDTAKQGQAISDLRRLLIEAAHPQSRERFLALLLIASGQTNATRWARKGSHATDRLVVAALQLNWTEYPGLASYRMASPLIRTQVTELVTTVQTTNPVHADLLGHGWTLKKIACLETSVWALFAQACQECVRLIYLFDQTRTEKYKLGYIVLWTSTQGAFA